MAKLRIIAERDAPAQVEYAGLGQDPISGVRWSKLLSPPDYRLWLALSELVDGATLTWTDTHADEGICVLEGALEVEGHQALAGGAVIIENGVAGQARAVGVTRVAHFGPRNHPPVTKPGKYVHVYGPQGAARVSEGVPGVWVDFFTDGSCESCHLMLFRVHRDAGFMEQPIPHIHTADELMLVVDGIMLLGRREVEAMSALIIPGNVRYVQTCGPSGSTFLNYRSGPSTMTRYPAGQKPISLPEGSFIHGGVVTGEVVNVPSRRAALPA
jgi:hypothetical protein